MSVAAGLLNVPHDGPSWDIWGFLLDQNIREINAAIQARLNFTAPQYVLYPVPQNAIGEWLQRLSQALGTIAGLLKIDEADIENVNLQDDRERAGWAYQIFTEVQASRRVLGI